LILHQAPGRLADSQGPKDEYQPKASINRPQSQYVPHLGREAGSERERSDSQEGLRHDYGYAPSAHSHSKESQVSQVLHGAGVVHGEKDARAWA
jgi:hypothetical protein